MTHRHEHHLRPETPTRALLRRVQRRSSAGVPPPPLPPKRYTISKLDQVAEGSRQSTAEASSTPEMDTTLQEQEDMETLMGQIDQMHLDINGQDARIMELEAQLRETTSSRGSNTMATSQGGGLTRAAALKLEREFASQERILQGLQKDNETKTIEVEKLRREKKTMADYLARQYGVEDWEKVVFGPNSSYISRSGTLDAESGGAEETTPNKHSMGVMSPIRAAKGPLARLAKTSEGVAEASFFSADESIVDPPLPTSSSPPPIMPSAAGVDLAAILTLIESQKMLIKGFERTNALKMVECNEQLRMANEKEELWSRKLTLHQQQT
jgi:hypothetical protein